MKQYLLSRLSERSTWAGIIAVLGAFGVWQSSPEQASAITALALAVFGGFNTVAPDRMRRDVQPPPDDEPGVSRDGTVGGKVSYWSGKVGEPIFPDER